MANVLALSGCLPLPILSGYLSLSRENVGGQVPDFIVEGQTTREDVLLRLGEPDLRGPGDRYFSYGSTYRQGGVAFITVPVAGAAIESIRYRRINVRFNASGVVTRVEFVERECPSGMAGVSSAYFESPPCLNVRGGWTTEDATEPNVVIEPSIP